jgi:fructose-1,6-bisphosphatase I
LGEYVLSHPNITCPPSGKIVSINQGLLPEVLNKGIADYLESSFLQSCTARYIGSLVADFHRNMLKGGIFLYPETGKQPQGKLRLLFEAQALAMVVEQAGGKATDGVRRIMEIQPTSIHQTTPFYIGSKDMVDALHPFLIH